MRRICTVVGVRPQFIQLAAISWKLRKDFQKSLVHAGQHDDPNMSDGFF